MTRRSNLNPGRCSDLLSHHERELEFLRQRVEIDDFLHRSPVWPAADEPPQLRQTLVTSLGSYLDGAVPPIGHPAVQAEPSRRNADEPPEAHALNKTRYAEMSDRHDFSAVA